MNVDTERGRKIGEMARKMCNCYSCQGGYPLGEFTIAGGGELRPMSCLASTYLTHLLELWID